MRFGLISLVFLYCISCSAEARRVETGDTLEVEIQYFFDGELFEFRTEVPCSWLTGSLEQARRSPPPAYTIVDDIDERGMARSIRLHPAITACRFPEISSESNLPFKVTFEFWAVDSVSSPRKLVRANVRGALGEASASIVQLFRFVRRSGGGSEGKEFDPNFFTDRRLDSLRELYSSKTGIESRALRSACAVYSLHETWGRWPALKEVIQELPKDGGPVILDPRNPDFSAIYDLQEQRTTIGWNKSGSRQKDEYRGVKFTQSTARSGVSCFSFDGLEWRQPVTPSVFSYFFVGDERAEKDPLRRANAQPVDLAETFSGPFANVRLAGKSIELRTWHLHQNAASVWVYVPENNSLWWFGRSRYAIGWNY